MVQLKPSLLTLVALVQNVFYVYTPPQINKVFVRLEGEIVSTNRTWLPLVFTRIETTPVFFTPILGNDTDYLHFRLRMHYVNGTGPWLKVLLGLPSYQVQN